MLNFLFDRYYLLFTHDFLSVFSAFMTNTMIETEIGGSYE